MSRFSFSTLQGNHSEQGDYSSSGLAITGIGLGIYTGAAGDVTIRDVRGNVTKYTAVPQGVFMQVPMFTEIVAAGTTSADLTVTSLSPPYK